MVVIFLSGSRERRPASKTDVPATASDEARLAGESVHQLNRAIRDD